ncbi:MAG: hypothetical protein ACLTY5_11920 [Angelakisella sp.]
MKIHESRLAEGHGKPGELIALDPVTVACGEGALRLITVQPEGKPRMAAADWLRGRGCKKASVWRELAYLAGVLFCDEKW